MGIHGETKWCVLGNLQTDEDAPHTYSPTASSAAFHILMQISATEDLELRHLDVNQAFLQADIDGVVYIEQAEGFKVPGKEDYIILLNKSLYGLRQAPFLWYNTLREYLASIDFSSSPADAFYKKTPMGKLIVLVHVDDFAVAGTHNHEIQELYKSLDTRFGVRDEGELCRFLSYHVLRDRSAKTLTLHQNDYIASTLELANMSDAFTSPSPGDLFTTLSKEDCPKTAEDNELMQNIPYRQIIGCITQISRHTRPEISHQISSLARFTANPGTRHWKAAKQLLRYLKGTSTVGITYNGNRDIKLRGWVDASLACCRDIARSVLGYFFTLGSAAVSWKSRYSTTVLPSSTESEIGALYAATSEAIWLRKLLQHLGYSQIAPTPLGEDNQGAIKWSAGDNRGGRLQHIDIKTFFIREMILTKIIQLIYVPSMDNPADILTKPLTGSTFMRHRRTLGIIVPDRSAAYSHRVGPKLKAGLQRSGSSDDFRPEHVGGGFNRIGD
jgi:hypothetical protein